MVRPLWIRPLMFVCVLGLLGAACGNDVEGRRLHCTDSERVLPVQVVDAHGKPVKDATVSAVPASQAASGGAGWTQTSDGDGKVTFDESTASGTLELTAQAGGKTSATATATWVCGDCDCTVTPPQVALQLP